MNSFLINTINETLALSTNLLRAESYRDTIRFISYIGTKYERCVYEAKTINELVSGKPDFDMAVRLSVVQEAREKFFLTNQEIRDKYFDENPTNPNWYEEGNKLHQEFVLKDLKFTLEELKPLSTEQQRAFEKVQWILNCRRMLFEKIDNMTSDYFKVTEKDNQFFISSPLDPRHHFNLSSDNTSITDDDLLPELDELTAFQNYISNAEEPITELNSFDEIYEEYKKLPYLFHSLHKNMQNNILMYILTNSTDFKLIGSSSVTDEDAIFITLPKVVAYKNEAPIATTVVIGGDFLIAWHNLSKALFNSKEADDTVKAELLSKYSSYDSIIRFSAKYL